MARALAKSRKLNERVVNALADAAIGLQVRNPTYRNQVQVSNQVAKYDLKRLADEGLLIPKGEKRGRHYVASKEILELRDKTRLEKPPQTDPFVEVGSQVKPGDVLCIIESMKMMNEIKAEHGGVCTAVSVANGQPVSAGDVLFRIA